MGAIKRMQPLFPETWPATILFLLHFPYLMLVVNLVRLPLLESLVQVPEYNALVERYGQSATFLTIYIREAHAVDGEWPQEQVRQIGTHTSLRDRLETGKQLKKDVEIQGEIVVDDMGDFGALTWGASPESWAVICPDGIIEDVPGMGPWGYDLQRLESTLCKTLSKRFI